MKQIFDLLKNFTANKRTLGINVSPRSVLEAVYYDSETGQILSHKQTDINYDPVLRQMDDLSDMEVKLVRFIQDMQIPQGTPTILTLPTTFINQQILPPDLNDEEINFALISEAEKNYFFRRNEPTVSWINPNTPNAEVDYSLLPDEHQPILYSAFKKEEIDQIEEMAKRISLGLVAVDSSYAAMIRGLYIAGITQDDIQDQNIWCTIVVSANNVAVITLDGGRIINVFEEPVAIKSLNEEDVYPFIVSSCIDRIKEQSPAHVVIISETDDVSAEGLSTYFEIRCKITFIEENKYCKQSLFSGYDITSTDDTGAVQFVSLEAVGSACWDQCDVDLNFNFIQSAGLHANCFEVNLLGKSFLLTSKSLLVIIIGLIVYNIVVMAGFYLLISSLGGAIDAKIQSFDTMKQQVQAEIDANKQASTSNLTKASAQEIVYKTYDDNSKFLQSYNTIGGLIPEKLWLDSFSVKSDMTAEVKGKAISVEDIISYYQSLVRICKFRGFKISGIKVVDNTNTNNAGASTPAQPATPTQPAGMPPGGETPGASGLPSVPAMPSLPNITTGAPNNNPGSGLPSKYYEFTFASDATATAPAQTTGGSSPAAPGPMGPMGMSPVGSPAK